MSRLRSLLWWTTLADHSAPLLDLDLSYDPGSDTLDIGAAHLTANGSPVGGSAFAHLTEDTNSINATWPVQIGGTVGEIDLGTDGFVDIFFDDTTYTGSAVVFRVEKWSGGRVFEITADGQLQLNNGTPFTPSPTFAHLTEDVAGLHYDGDVYVTGNVNADVAVNAPVFICTVAGSGLNLMSPDGLTVKQVTIDNSGALVLV